MRRQNSASEQALKKERAECMWKALERIIPDVRKRTEVELVATPLTHEFFNRRFKGAACSMFSRVVCVTTVQL